MVDYSRRVLSGAGYRPYYMYRQGKSVGNLENTGWCKPGRDCLYNVFMMDETHTVLAVGAGAVTRLKNPQRKKFSEGMFQMRAAIGTGIVYRRCIGDRRRGRWQKTKTHPGMTSRGQGASCAKEIISQTSAVSWRWD